MRNLILISCLTGLLLQGCVLPERKCLRGDLQIPHPTGAMMKMGNIEVCGYDMSVSGLYGPSFEKVIDDLKDDLREQKEGQQ